MDILGNFFQFIFDLVLKLTDLILTPINAILDSYLPSVSGALDIVGTFFTELTKYGRFVVSWTGLKTQYVQIIVLLILNIIFIPVATNGFKTLVKWFSHLKV